MYPILEIFLNSTNAHHHAFFLLFSGIYPVRGVLTYLDGPHLEWCDLAPVTPEWMSE